MVERTPKLNIQNASVIDPLPDIFVSSLGPAERWSSGETTLFSARDESWPRPRWWKRASSRLQNRRF
jgi:hypothetical protein